MRTREALRAYRRTGERAMLDLALERTGAKLARWCAIRATQGYRLKQGRQWLAPWKAEHNITEGIGNA